MPEKLRVLPDTSVVIAALNSTTGASAEIFNPARRNRLLLITTPYIISETEEVIRRKFPKLQPLFQELKSGMFLVIAEDPPLTTVKQAARIISDLKDAPILAAAMTHRVDYLVTLDHRDFIDDKKVAQKSQIKIVTPAALTLLLKDRGNY